MEVKASDWLTEGILFSYWLFNANPETFEISTIFGSFYPWHTGKAYGHFCTDEDNKMREEVKAFRYELLS